MDDKSSDAHRPPPRLTSLARGCGCGCKLPAADLQALLSRLAPPHDERVLVGLHTGDDAAVVALDYPARVGRAAAAGGGRALVQTVDFFTPVVDDPRAFGAIAAANALSDVYAMGGRPLCALGIVGFPLERLGGEVLGAILAGALEVLGEAGAALVGGHSIDDPEPKFGLAVTGTVDPRRMLTNAGARAGDALVLTKPLGTGVAVTLAARDEAPAALEAAAIETMRALNAHAGECAVRAGGHAAADVTGFGLLGHLHAIARESHLVAELDAAAVPVLDGVREPLSGGRGLSGGTRRNARWAASFTSFADGVPEWRRWLLADATTSGGLLVAVAPEHAHELPGVVVGRMAEGAAGTVRVR